MFDNNNSNNFPTVNGWSACSKRCGLGTQVKMTGQMYPPIQDYRDCSNDCETRQFNISIIMNYNLFV